MYKNNFAVDHWNKFDSTITFFPVLNNKLPELPATAVKAFDINRSGILLVNTPKGWDIPGGHIEQGENALTALKREILEETGGIISMPKIRGYLDIISSKHGSKYPPHGMIIMYSGIITDINIESLNMESTDVRRFSLESLPSIFGDNWSKLNSQITEYFAKVT